MTNEAEAAVSLIKATPIWDFAKGLFWTIAGLAGTLITYISGVTIKKTNNNSNDINQLRLEHAQFKLEAERTYASKSDIKESLDRVHDRIDEGNEQQATTQEDIKKILTIVGNGHK